MKLAGQYVLVTGAALRIGRAVALEMAGRGASVILHYNRSQAQALKLKAQVESMGVRAFLAQQDFSVGPALDQTRTFCQDVFRLVPRVDVLVNNASIFYPTSLEEIAQEDWDNFMNVNLAAPFFLAQELGLRMKKQKSGKIVNLSDWTAVRPHPRYIPYAISKAGLEAATVGLARALAPYVQVNSIAPGPILPSRGMSPAQQKAVADSSLLKRFGSPEDIAKAVRYLVEDGDFVTGTCLPVEGGSLLA